MPVVGLVLCFAGVFGGLFAIVHALTPTLNEQQRAWFVLGLTIWIGSLGGMVSIMVRLAR